MGNLQQSPNKLLQGYLYHWKKLSPVPELNLPCCTFNPWVLVLVTVIAENQSVHCYLQQRLWICRSLNNSVLFNLFLQVQSFDYFYPTQSVSFSHSIFLFQVRIAQIHKCSEGACLVDQGSSWALKTFLYRLGTISLVAILVISYVLISVLLH